MPSLDGYSLSKEIERVEESVREDLLKLRNEFTEMYSYMKKLERTSNSETKAPKKKK
ncbi:MAG: hypothetical protein H8E12_01715 [Rhodobacteraceae bacterium]|nr:hypothetical protein [Paracoccaceae bacterium]